MDRRRVLKYLGLAAATARVGATPLAAIAQAAQPTTAGPEANFLFNQLGFLPSQQKVISVRGLDQAPPTFQVLSTRSGGHPVITGQLTAPQIDSASGDSLRQAVLPSLTEPGEYRVELTGRVISEPFTVGDHVYADALRSTIRGYYGQRCGCSVDLGHGYQHPPCHLNGDYSPTSGKSGPLPSAGGWHDAGDYGRYVVNSGITCGTLLWAWEMFPSVLRSRDLGIPNTRHPKLPDFLEEVLWNLNWMLQLQDTDGGVFHKQTSDQFCAFIMPQDDHLVSEVVGTGSAPYKSTCATADLAAVMAIAARCYKEFDPALATRFLTSAEKAWQWAIAHPNVPFTNPPGISTGGYGDPHCSDEISWASAELWRTTGEAQYESAFLSGLPADRNSLTLEAPSWGNVGPLACWTYVLSSRHGDSRVEDAIRAATQTSAQRLIAQAQSNGYGNTLASSDYVWGSNGVAGNQSLLLLIANHFSASTEARTSALNNLHYLLGRNCFAVSWVTQVGRRPFMHPHHRPSAADNIAAPWPGLLSGGPNQHPGDPAARKVPHQPPMRMWTDETMAYSMNEIAINWNAPLVFTLAAANAMHSA